MALTRLSELTPSKIITTATATAYGRGVTYEEVLYTATKDCRIMVECTPLRGFDTAVDIQIGLNFSTGNNTTFFVYWYSPQQPATTPSSTFPGIGKTRTLSFIDNTISEGTNKWPSTTLVPVGTIILYRIASTVGSNESLYLRLTALKPEGFVYDQF